MPKRTSTARPDVVQNAKRVFDHVIETTETVSLTLISQVMSEMGRKGGKIGGKRRLVTMTDERRSQVASDAAKARWAKAKAKTITTKPRKRLA
jgi:hypothetical protein